MSHASIVSLDTTAVADRTFGSQAVRRAIDAELAGKQVVASRYVREQFRATFLRAMVLVYNQLQELRDPIQVLRRTDSFKCFTHGDGVKARKVLLTILEHADLDVDDMLDHIERSIEHDLMADFDSLCALVDGTSCCLCAPKPERDSNGIFRFEKSCTLAEPRPCRIDQFWVDHKAELTSLANAAETDVPSAAVSAAGETRSGESPRGKRCYVGLSDSIIIVESPIGSAILTTNLRDFVPLTRILGRRRSVRPYPSI